MENLNVAARRHAGWNRSAVAWLLVLTVGLWVTGVAMHLSVRDSVLDLPLWQENLQRGATVSHGILTWLFCFMAGRWIWPHINLVWRRRSHPWIWAIGITTAAGGAILAGAGLGLLYAPAPWHDALSLTHWWAGLLWPVVCASHAWKRLLRRR